MKMVMKIQKTTVLVLLVSSVELCRAFGEPNDGDSNNDEYTTS